MAAINGREIVLKEFTIKDLKAIRDAFTIDTEMGMWTVLSMTAFYKDDDSRAFDSPETIQGMPARFALTLTKLADDALKLNGMYKEEEAAPLH